MKILGVIPARYASTRFPAKPLVDISGQSMIERVYRQAKKSTKLSHVVVATDHELIFQHVNGFGGNVVMTAAHHPSGTDRIQEAHQKQSQPYDYIINIQGDEPFIAPEQIDLLASMLDGNTALATLIKKIEDTEQLFNPNVVKAIRNQDNEAIYFSRSPIPHIRNQAEQEWLAHHVFYKHIGMYAYRADILKNVTELPQSTLEKAESLEQLRWIESGLKIKVAETHIETIGIDTPADLQKALAYLKTV